MPGLDDWTLTPYRVLDNVFDECGGAEGDWRGKVRDYFTHEANNTAVIKRIPWLNDTALHTLRPNQVVRYRGMVQDMFDTEFFLDTYEVRDTKTGETKIRPGRYRDIAECLPGEEVVQDSPRSQTGDRLLYYCVPVPGETKWVQQAYRDQSPTPCEASTSGGVGRAKRSACEEDEDNNNALPPQPQNTGVDSDENKRPRTSGAAGPSTAAPPTPDLNFPLPGMKGVPCLVKLYDDQSFSLNDVVEVVGILSVDPSLAPSAPGDEGAQGELGLMEVEEEAARCPPPSLVPRLHVLTARKMPHTNPLVSPEPPSATPGEMREAREVLRGVLEEALLGDALAAELMVCHLVSSVYLRQDVVALGKYCINLSGISTSLQGQGYTKGLAKLLSSLVTQAHYFPMTINTMNKVNFVPRKDYQANRLVSGLLQLPQHTHLIVDETTLSAGQLDQKGVSNLTALGNLVNWQKVDYDFQYHQLEQQSNVPVLIMSEGRSMITSDAEVRLQPNTSDASAALSSAETKLSPDVVTRLRQYLTVARLAQYDMTDDMQKVVQEDFVESRKNDPSITAEDLHRQLILARLVAVSCGEARLTGDVWRSAKILDAERKLRVNTR